MRVFDGAGDRVEICAPTVAEPLTLRLIETRHAAGRLVCMPPPGPAPLARSQSRRFVPAMRRRADESAGPCSGYPQFCAEDLLGRRKPSAPRAPSLSAVDERRSRAPPHRRGPPRSSALRREEIGLIPPPDGISATTSPIVSTPRASSPTVAVRRVARWFRMRDLAGSGLRLVGNVADGSGRASAARRQTGRGPIRLREGISGFERLLRGVGTEPPSSAFDCLPQLADLDGQSPSLYNAPFLHWKPLDQALDLVLAQQFLVTIRLRLGFRGACAQGVCRGITGKRAPHIAPPRPRPASGAENRRHSCRPPSCCNDLRRPPDPASNAILEIAHGHPGHAGRATSRQGNGQPELAERSLAAQILGKREIGGSRLDDEIDRRIERPR